MILDTASLLQPWHIWLIVGIVCVIGEMLTVGFVLLCFAIGAFIAAVPAFMQAELKYQIMVFAVSTVIVLASFRKLYLNWLQKSDAPPTNIDALSGKEAVVLVDIDNTKGLGRVKLGGEDWAARSEDGGQISKDAIVIVKKVDGNKLIVAVKKDDECPDQGDDVQKEKEA